MYAVLMTALVSVDAQSQSFCLFQRFHQRRAARMATSGCGGYVSCGCWSSCGGYSTCHSYPAPTYSTCFSYCQTTTVCCGCAIPAQSYVVIQEAVPMPIAATYSVPATGIAPAAADPSLTPSNEAEREAIRQALKGLRERKAPPTNPGIPSIPPINPKLDVPPPPPGLSAQAKVTIRVPENAKLWVDDVACPLEGEVRTFATPTLEAGLEYGYTLRIAVERDGKMATEERLVRFAAGRNVEVDFGGTATQTVRR